MEKRLKRREFLKKASVAVIGGGSGALAACSASTENSGPAVQTRRTYEWKMVTTWPPGFPILGDAAVKVAEWIGQMSENRLKIHVYGGGELIPALEGFDAVSQGTAEMCHGASYYWAGKTPGSQFFSSVPFGMNAQQMNAWIYGGGGLKLWEDLYAPFNLTPMPVGNTGVQMGGWFNREIKTVADLKGLKMRIPGLGGKVIAKAGGSAILSAGAEIFTNLERGVIDATEWIGPYHDYLMGFYKAAKYYYYPGWHEPGSVLELIINKTAFDALSPDLQTIIRAAAAWSNAWTLSEFEAQNDAYLKKLVTEHKTQLKKFPDEVLATLRKYADEVMNELAASDAPSKKILESFNAFQKNVAGWADVSEKVYYSSIGL